jgi:hypothetical protein
VSVLRSAPVFYSAEEEVRTSPSRGNSIYAAEETKSEGGPALAPDPTTMLASPRSSSSESPHARLLTRVRARLATGLDLLRQQQPTLWTAEVSTAADGVLDRFPRPRPKTVDVPRHTDGQKFSELYTLTALIANGGGANVRVHRATHNPSGAVVAVKGRLLTAADDRAEIRRESAMLQEVWRWSCGCLCARLWVYVRVSVRPWQCR